MNTTPSPTSSRPTRLTRSTTDRKVGGVAGGLADYLGVDPLAVRLGFAIGSLFSGAGLLAYILMLAFVPEQDSPAVARPVAACPLASPWAERQLGPRRRSEGQRAARREPVYLSPDRHEG